MHPYAFNMHPYASVCTHMLPYALFTSRTVIFNKQNSRTSKKIKNKSKTSALAYDININNIERYWVTPSSGILEPGDGQTVLVEIRPDAVQELYADSNRSDRLAKEMGKDIIRIQCVSLLETEREEIKTTDDFKTTVFEDGIVDQSYIFTRKLTVQVNKKKMEETKDDVNDGRLYFVCIEPNGVGCRNSPVMDDRCEGNMGVDNSECVVGTLTEDGQWICIVESNNEKQNGKFLPMTKPGDDKLFFKKITTKIEWVNATYTNADGQSYVGEWNDGKRHGQGIWTLADGTIFHSGEWVNGEPTK